MPAVLHACCLTLAASSTAGLWVCHTCSCMHFQETCKLPSLVEFISHVEAHHCSPQCRSMESDLGGQSPDGASPQSALPLHVSRGTGGLLSRESKSGPSLRNAKVPASDAAPLLQVPAQVQSRSPASTDDSSSGSATPAPHLPTSTPLCSLVGNMVCPTPF